MKIYVDADACPKPVREILFRVAIRNQIELLMVANQILQLPVSTKIRMMQVNKGFNEADNEIVKLINKDDLLVTADIPLASDAIDKGAIVINPRGKIYSMENIKQELATRDLLAHLRDSLEIRGGPQPYNDKDKAAFANALDRIIISHLNSLK